MKEFLPEGLPVHTNVQSFTPAALRAALSERLPLQATAMLCDEEHNLHVSLGSEVSGLIPREEAALGIREGTVRDVAILARVGKPVSFYVTSLTSRPDGGVQAILSRRAAQADALAALMERRPGDILPAVVTNPARFGAFCDVGCGVTALLGVESISVARIEHSRDRFSEGQRIFAVIRAIDREKQHITLTHRELLGTWEENAAGFSAGQTVTGFVRSRKEYGYFVELTPNLSGLAESREELHPGDPVCVYIKSIRPERMKIKLIVLKKLDPQALPPQPLCYYKTSGHLDSWRYAPDGLEKPNLTTVF